MSDPCSAYPKATAWTFLLDTPAEEGGASATKAPPPGGGGHPRLAAAAAAAAGVRAAAKKKASLGGSSGGSSGTEEMGAACSKSKAASVANKENMAKVEDMLLVVPNGGKNEGPDTAESTSLGEIPETLEALEEDPVREGAVLGVGALDSTAFLSPEPEQEEGVAAGDSALVAVENCVAGLRRGGHAGDGSDGMRCEDNKSAWIAQNLDVVPQGAAVEVDQLKQVRTARVCSCSGLHSFGSCMYILPTDDCLCVFSTELRRRVQERRETSQVARKCSSVGVPVSPCSVSGSWGAKNG